MKIESQTPRPLPIWLPVILVLAALAAALLYSPYHDYRGPEYLQNRVVTSLWAAGGVTIIGFLWFATRSYSPKARRAVIISALAVAICLPWLLYPSRNFTIEKSPHFYISYGNGKCNALLDTLFVGTFIILFAPPLIASAYRSGIKGGLLLLCAYLSIITPMLSIIAIFSNVFPSRMQPWIIAEACFVAVVGLLLWSRRFVGLVIAYFYFSVTLVVSLVSIFMLLRSENSRDLAVPYVANCIRIFAAIACITYLAKATRVRFVFRRAIRAWRRPTPFSNAIPTDTDSH